MTSSLFDTEWSAAIARRALDAVYAERERQIVAAMFADLAYVDVEDPRVNMGDGRMFATGHTIRYLLWPVCLPVARGA